MKKSPITTYFTGVKTEFKKVQWPTKKRFQRSFWVVILSIAMATVAVLIIDFALQLIVKSVLI